MSLAFLRRGPELNLDQHPFSQQAVYDDSRRGGIWRREELTPHVPSEVVVVNRLGHDVVDGLHHRLHRGPGGTQDLGGIRVDLTRLLDEV